VVFERTENGRRAGSSELEVTDVATCSHLTLLLFKSGFKIALKNPEFGDGLLPGFISFAALCAWLLNKFFYHSDVGKALSLQIIQLM